MDVRIQFFFIGFITASTSIYKNYMRSFQENKILLQKNATLAHYASIEEKYLNMMYANRLDTMK